jgi:hypothetical protein
MSAYTPGPWFIEATSRIGHHAVIDGDGFTICNPSPMGEANARLIANAPDMFEALQNLVDYLGADVDNGLDELLTKARAAIEKATKGVTP